MGRNKTPTLIRYARLLHPGSRPAFTYYSDGDVDEAYPHVECAIVIVHGTERDGDRYFRAMARARRKAGDGQETRTLVVAPQFFSDRDARKHNVAPETLVWNLRDWKEGNASRCRRASAFDVLDGVLARFANKERYPDLNRVVMAGHSAGAQLVQRYAAANPTEDALRARAVAVRYIVANPSSYLYLDRSRPGLGLEGGAAMTSATFEACPNYNSYKYGLEALNPYLAAIGPETIRQRYGEREVIYLLGRDDDDPHARSLDRSCAAQLQGATRLERGLAFHAHLRRFYGEGIGDRHVLEVVPGVGHQGPRILRSDAGRRWLFAAER